MYRTIIAFMLTIGCVTPCLAQTSQSEGSSPSMGMSGTSDAGPKPYTGKMMAPMEMTVTMSPKTAEEISQDMKNGQMVCKIQRVFMGGRPYATLVCF